MPCAVNGITLSATPDYLPLVQCLNAGVQATVRALSERFGGPDCPLSAQDIVEALEQLAAPESLKELLASESWWIGRMTASRMGHPCRRTGRPNFTFNSQMLRSLKASRKRRKRRPHTR